MTGIDWTDHTAPSFDNRPIRSFEAVDGCALYFVGRKRQAGYGDPEASRILAGHSC